MTDQSPSRNESVYLCRASGEGSHDFRICKDQAEVEAFYVEMTGRDYDGTIDSLTSAFNDPDEWSNDGTALELELYCAKFEVWKVDPAQLSVVVSETRDTSELAVFLRERAARSHPEDAAKFNAAADVISAPSAERATAEKRRMQGCCIDCGRKYGDEHGFPDLVVPDEAWKSLSPTGDEGGLLCPSCLCRRAHDAGVQCEAQFTSGPFVRSASVPIEDPGTLKMLTALVERAYGIFTASGVLRVAEQDPDSNDPIVAWASDVRSILYRNKPAAIDSALKSVGTPDSTGAPK